MSKECATDEMDQIDRRLLRLLQDDATLSNAALGEQLSMTVTPCWRRRKRLEELGIIKGYQALLDRKKMGFGVLAFAQVRFGDHADKAADRFEELIQQRQEVLTCHKVTGEADFVLTVVATDLESYGRFVEDVLRKQPGVITIQSSLSLQEVKSVTKIPV